jgi:hypothetical protein
MGSGMARRMSYLDDPEHDWVLDPASEGGNLLSDITHLYLHGDLETIALVLQGYHGLKTRFPEASDAACFATSMIWYFG